MPIHLFGQLADMDSIMLFAKNTIFRFLKMLLSLMVLNIKEKEWGSLGMLLVFLYILKNPGALWDSGIIVSNDDGLFKNVTSLVTMVKIENTTIVY